MSRDWKDLEEPWQRLKWARMKAGYQRAKDAADSMGIKPVTYRSYERPVSDAGRGLKLDVAQRFARKFKISWTWLLLGEGTPDVEHAVPPEMVVITRRLENIVDAKARSDAVDMIFGILDVIERKAG